MNNKKKNIKEDLEEIIRFLEKNKDSETNRNIFIGYFGAKLNIKRKEMERTYSDYQNMREYLKMGKKAKRKKEVRNILKNLLVYKINREIYEETPNRVIEDFYEEHGI